MWPIYDMYASLDRNWQAYPRLLCLDGPEGDSLNLYLCIYMCDVGKFICAVIVRIRDKSKDGMCLGAGSSSLVWAIMREHKVIAPTLIPQSHGVKVGEISVRKRRRRHHRSYGLTPVSIGHAGLAHLPNPYFL